MEDNMNQLKLRQMLEGFFLEDIGENDVTSQTIFPPNQQGKGVFVAKASGVIAGLPVMREAYCMLDSKIELTFHFSEGDWVNAGYRIAEVSGPVAQLLTGERVILNLMQRMSGIATMTKKSVDALNDSSINICDTRKTV